MAPPSTPKIRHRNFNPSPTNHTKHNHHPSSSLTINTSNNSSNDNHSSHTTNHANHGIATTNNHHSNDDNSSGRLYANMASPKVHGRAKRRDELLRSNKTMVVIAGAVAVLALCLVGLWASQSSIHSTAGGDGGGSSSSINNYLETFPSFEETKARGGSSSNTPKKKAREVIHNGQTKEEEKTDKKERLNEIVSNIRENRKKLGVIFSGDERAKKNKLMELYQTTPIGTETRAEKTASDEINNDPSMKKAPRVKTEEEGGHNDVETDDDASNSEAVTFQRRYKKLDRSKGERLSASVSLPLQEVDMKQWGYVPRPRVVSCEFERISDINKPTTNYGERNIMMNNSNDDNLYDTSMVITAVVRLPHHEPSPLLASKQYVTPYPDDDAYIDGIKDVIKNSKKYRHHAREPLAAGTCIAKHEWQKDAYPNCNILHEFELGALTSMYGRMIREGLNVREGDGDEQMRYWSHGFWRDVWLVSKAITTSTITISPNKEEITVLKTLRYNHDFTDRNYDRHRKDALASMRLSNSPNVVDIYAYCSNSAIFEYGDGGDVDEKLFPWDSKAKKYYVAELSSLEKIDIAYQVARAIADIHDVEDDGLASIAHTDITPSQFIYIDGRYKVNDFNRCRFMRVDENDNSPCGFFVGANPGKFRAPEEYAYEVENEMIDIYSMGNIFYAIIAGDMPYEGTKEKEAQKKVREGDRPKIPDDVLNSNDFAIQAIISATKRCWEQNPKNRPSAAVIRDELKAVMDRMQQ